MATYIINTTGTLSPNKKWKTSFSPGGFFRTVLEGTNTIAQSSPDISTSTLKAARIDGMATFSPGIHGKIRCRLDVQNAFDTQPWYTVWPMLAYVSNTTQIYCAIKTNGFEIGKKDNDLAPSLELQEYIKTGSTPYAVVGAWNTLEWWIAPNIESTNLRIRVKINGVTVYDGLDTATLNKSLTLPGSVYNGSGWQRNGTTGSGSSPYFISAPKGFSFYSEASQCSWDDIRLESITVVPT